MPKELIPQKKPEAENALKTLGLKANPFHADPDPTEPPRTFADFRDVWIMLEDKVNTAISRGYNQRLMIFGSYGSGKSHILRFLAHQIGSSYSHQDNRGISFYGAIPLTMRFSDLYTSFIKSISKEKLVFLRNLSFKKGASPINEELKNALSHLGKDDSKDEIAWRWICALPTYTDERLNIGVTTKLEKNDQACLSMLVSLISLLLEKDVKIVFIGIDELERLRTLSASERRSTQNFLEYFRQLIDLLPQRVFLVLAGSNEWERVFTGYGAFSSRFSMNEKCYLKSFKEKNMAEFKLFIFEYLDIERIKKDEFFASFGSFQSKEKIAGLSDSEFKDAGVSDKNDLQYLNSWEDSSKEIRLYPFSSDALEYILNLSRGVPRSIIQICNLLIERAIDELTALKQMPDKFIITSRHVESIELLVAPKTEAK